MKNNRYQDFRQELLEFLRRDAVGPFSDDEVIDDAPTIRYSAGILFPQSVEAGEQRNEGDENLDTRSRDEEEVGVIEQATSFYPSALGLSFSVAENTKELNVEVETARYANVDKDDASLISYPMTISSESYFQNQLFADKFDYKDGLLSLKSLLSQAERDNFIEVFGEDKELKNALYKLFRLSENGWKRLAISRAVNLKLPQGKSEIQIEGEQLKIVAIVKPLGKGTKLCTVSLINTATTEQSQNDHKKSYFQASLKLSGVSEAAVFEDLGKTDFPTADPEEQSLKLLYRNKKFYATGHGCSAAWTSSDSGERAVSIQTESIPNYIVPQMTFDLISTPDLRMATLAYAKDPDVLSNLENLVGAYESWISRLVSETKTLDKSLQKAAENHIDLCNEAAKRMRGGMTLLKNDKQSMRAFRLANEAMLMQRTHTILQLNKKLPDDAVAMPDTYDDSTSEKPSTWRPFQIAFILMGIESMSNGESQFKDIVDLIWFPTGGGKTEAYLGLTAFSIFYRRLTNSDDVSGGTTVLMRYTLRLLTSQQFQRANTLICACEKLRRSQADLGTTVISIGLWLGGGSTPNTIKDAEFRLAELMRQGDTSTNNPFQVLSCPWCGTHMVKKDGRGTNGYQIKSRPARFVMWCPNTKCDFHQELPIAVIDEDVYREAPTLLFGTVDKFAMLPWKAESARIFALDAGNPSLSPELIIQDELHLISGSLGTMVGLYESAIDLMCSAKGKKPKIIASTATIRRAKEQCNALYARDVRQFPSPGLDASDSFFAREAEISSDNPGRLYAGIMPSGKTSTTMQVRLMANAIQATSILNFPDEVKDKFWTQVVYCNSIRELGSSKSIVYDDVKEYSSAVADRYHKKPRRYSDNDVQELTSRIPAEAIPEILQRLNVEYPNPGAIDTLLATNMISVGVDIDRLGLMLILGQPKTTSEYIQASSRVGRKYPGLVLTLYSPVKSRDRSHFEQFIKYHQSLYRYVEPTSVTPFSAPVRDKALHAVIITLVRHYMGVESSKQLADFNPDSEKLGEIVEAILTRVGKVDSSEVESTKKDIAKIIDSISEISKMGDTAMFGPANSREKIGVMRRPSDESYLGRYATPQSMRSTDVECAIRLDYSA